jgi:SAM-dependent methyltransferase
MSAFWARYPDEASACPACASSRISLLDVIPTLRDRQGRMAAFISGCRDCGLLFANPQKSQEELDEYYAEAGAWAEQFDSRRIRAKGREKVKKPMTARDRLLIALEPFVPVNTPPPGARVLDFGCGDGKFLDRLQDRGWETYGIEPAMSVAFTRHKRLDVPPEDASFHFVIVHHVLEHVPEPLMLLQQLARSMRVGGVIFISLPRVDTLPQHRQLKYCLDGRKHLVAFTETCLSGLLARASCTTVANLDARELDEALTKGEPRRLRLVAARSATPPPLPESPLNPAIAALREYRRTGGHAGEGVPSWLPLRMRAALLDGRRQRAKRARKASTSA